MRGDIQSARDRSSRRHNEDRNGELWGRKSVERRDTSQRLEENRTSYQYGESLSSRDHYPISKTLDEGRSRYSRPKLEDKTYDRYQRPNRQHTPTLGENKRTEYNNLRGSIDQRHLVRRQIAENESTREYTSGYKERVLNPVERNTTPYHSLSKYQEPAGSPKKRIVKMFDLSKLEKKQLTNEQSEKSFVMLNSYYNTNLENSQPCVIDNKLEKPEKSTGHKLNKKSRKIENIKEEEIFMRDEYSEGTRQLEFVEQPGAKFMLETGDVSDSEEVKSLREASGRSNYLKVLQLSRVLKEKDDIIYELNKANTSLREENRRIKDEMSKQITLLASEVNHAKNMVLLTSTLAPSVTDSARSRTPKSPYSKGTCQELSSRSENRENIMLTNQTAANLIVFARSQPLGDVSRDYAEKMFKRVSESSDLYMCLRSLRDISSACVEASENSKVRDQPVFDDGLMLRQRVEILQNELTQIRWQNSITTFCLENFQYLLSTLSRSRAIYSRSVSSLSREYFDEVQRLLKKKYWNYENAENEINFSYLSSLIKEVTESLH